MVAKADIGSREAVIRRSDLLGVSVPGGFDIRLTPSACRIANGARRGADGPFYGVRAERTGSERLRGVGTVPRATPHRPSWGLLGMRGTGLSTPHLQAVPSRQPEFERDPKGEDGEETDRSSRPSRRADGLRRRINRAPRPDEVGPRTGGTGPWVESLNASATCTELDGGTFTCTLTLDETTYGPTDYIFHARVSTDGHSAEITSDGWDTFEVTEQ